MAAAKHDKARAEKRARLLAAVVEVYGQENVDEALQIDVFQRALERALVRRDEKLAVSSLRTALAVAVGFCDPME